MVASLRAFRFIITISATMLFAEMSGEQPPPADIRDVDMTCSNLVERLRSLQIDYKDSTSKLKKLEAETDKLRSEEDAIQSEQAAKSQSYESSMSEFALAQNEAEVARSQLKRAQELSSSLDERVRRIQSQLLSNTTKLRSLNYFVDSLQNERVQLSDRARKDELRIQMFDTDIDASKESVVVIRANLANKRRTLGLKKANVHMDEKVLANITSESERANRLVHEGTEKQISLRKAMGDNEQLGFNEERLVQTLEREKATLLEEASNFGSDLARRRHLREAYLSKALRGIISRLAATSQQVDQLKRYHASISMGISRISSHPSEPSPSNLSTTDAYLDELRDVVHGNRAFLLKHGYTRPAFVQIGSVAGYPDDLHLESEMLLLNEATHGLREQLALLKTDVNVFQATLSDDTRQINEIGNQLTMSTAKLHRLNETLAGHVGLIGRLRVQETSTREELDHTVDELRSRQVSYRNTTFKLKGVQSQLRADTTEVSHLEEAEHALESQLRYKVHDIDSLTSERQNVTSGLNFARNRLLTVNAEITKTKETTRLLTISTEQLSELLDSSKEALSNAIADVAHIGRRLQGKLHELEKAYVSIHASEGGMKESDSQARAALSRRTQLDMEIDATTAISHELASHISSLRPELESSSCGSSHIN